MPLISHNTCGVLCATMSKIENIFYKEKLAAFDAIIDEKALLNGKYILAQRGKKNYFLLIAK